MTKYYKFRGENINLVELLKQTKKKALKKKKACLRAYFSPETVDFIPSLTLGNIENNYSNYKLL